MEVGGVLVEVGGVLVEVGGVPLTFTTFGKSHLMENLPISTLTLSCLRLDVLQSSAFGLLNCNSLVMSVKLKRLHLLSCSNLLYLNPCIGMNPCLCRKNFEHSSNDPGIRLPQFFHTFSI